MGKNDQEAARIARRLNETAKLTAEDEQRKARKRESLKRTRDADARERKRIRAEVDARLERIGNKQPKKPAPVAVSKQAPIADRESNPLGRKLMSDETYEKLMLREMANSRRG